MESPFDIVGGVALLLWGLHMVRSGIMRAYGAEVRRLLTASLNRPFRGLLAGFAVTTLIQSSTATAMMTTSLVSRGLLAVAPALAVILGANIGTTVIVQFLSFNIAAISPVLIAIGVFAFKKSAATRTRDLGRTLIGLGLILLALHLLTSSISNIGQNPIVPELLRAGTQNPPLCLLIGAALSAVLHSSAAVVLVIMSLAGGGLMAMPMALMLTAGANLGAAIIPLLESATPSDPSAIRVPVANIANRLLGVALTAAFLNPLAAVFASFSDQARAVAAFHVAFNCATAATFFAFLPLITRLLFKVFPDKPAPADPYAVAYLDAGALETPGIALACAAREVLHIGDIVTTMLRDSIEALMAGDRKLVHSISRMDNAVDRLDEAVKLYVTRLTRAPMSEHDERRALEVIAFSINLEHIGDIIDKSLMELAAKKIKKKLQFSKEGAAEIEAFHRRVVENLPLAFGVFMTGDANLSERLIAEKGALRLAEASAADAHLKRLRDGRVESIDTSSLHLDIIRDLRRIHSHICSVAYPNRYANCPSYAELEHKACF